MKPTQNNLSVCPVTPVHAHKVLRNTLSPQSLSLDSIGNVRNALKFCLIARKNLIHKFGQDWIIHSLKNIGFKFNYTSLEDFLKTSEDTVTKMKDFAAHENPRIYISLFDIFSERIKRNMEKDSMNLEDTNVNFIEFAEAANDRVVDVDWFYLEWNTPQYKPRNFIL